MSPNNSLLFASLGFLVDNLWDTRNKMNVYDFATVWVILIVNAITGLLQAVLVGIVMAAFTFAYQYGQTTVIQSLISGDQFQSGIVRASFLGIRNLLCFSKTHDARPLSPSPADPGSTAEAQKLEHLGFLYVIVRLQRFLFFGSAAQVEDLVYTLLEQAAEEAAMHKKLRYILIDWTDVDGIDFTACNTIFTMLKKVESYNVMAIFTGMDEEVIEAVSRRRGLLCSFAHAPARCRFHTRS